MHTQRASGGQRTTFGSCFFPVALGSRNQTRFIRLVCQVVVNPLSHFTGPHMLTSVCFHCKTTSFWNVRSIPALLHGITFPVSCLTSEVLTWVCGTSERLDNLNLRALGFGCSSGISSIVVGIESSHTVNAE